LSFCFIRRSATPSTKRAPLPMQNSMNAAAMSQLIGCSLCVREEGSRESGPPLQHHWIELNAIITKNPPKKTKHHVMCQRAKRQSKWPKSTKIAAHCQFVTLYSWFKNHCNSSQTFTQLLVLKGLLPPRPPVILTEVLAWGS
jgi:hypothetical protein